MEYKERLAINKSYKENGYSIESFYDVSDIQNLNVAERIAWCSLKRVPGASRSFVPEVQVGEYFIDFADTNRKIGIEINGREFHKDRTKDAERIRFLESKGWKILTFFWENITGHEYLDDEANELDTFLIEELRLLY